MGTTRAGEQNKRVLTQNNSGSFQMTLPIELVRDLKWRRGQKVTVKVIGNSLVVEDWKK